MAGVLTSPIQLTEGVTAGAQEVPYFGFGGFGPYHPPLAPLLYLPTRVNKIGG